MSTLRILSAADVTAALPMPQAIDAMRHAFIQLSSGALEMPLRSRVATSEGVTLIMPAWRHGATTLAIKVVSVYDDNPARGLPLVSATVIVLDAETGQLKALIDGNSLTALRTGAGGGLAADLLARRDAEVVTLFGAGVQARAQLQGVMAVRAIKQVNLISRTTRSADRLAATIARWPNPPAVTVFQSESISQAIHSADIIITATTSTEPLFCGDDLRPGTHITAIGAYTPQMREIDPATVNRATIIVDSRSACAAEAGDLILARVEADAELGEVIEGKHPGRESNEVITLFKSVGVAIQDAAAAEAVLAAAERHHLGQRMTMA